MKTTDISKMKLLPLDAREAEYLYNRGMSYIVRPIPFDLPDETRLMGQRFVYPCDKITVDIAKQFEEIKTKLKVPYSWGDEVLIQERCAIDKKENRTEVIYDSVSRSVDDAVMSLNISRPYQDRLIVTPKSKMPREYVRSSAWVRNIEIEKLCNLSKQNYQDWGYRDHYHALEEVTWLRNKKSKNGTREFHTYKANLWVYIINLRVKEQPLSVQVFEHKKDHV